MSDGAEIAVDVWLPSRAEQKYPVMVNAARYYRSFSLWWPFSKLKILGNKPFPGLEFSFVRGFLAENIAVVIYDVRGSGASTGTNKCPWWPREREDASEIIAWIMEQPFCNRKIGLWGTSYSGNSALHTSFEYASSYLTKQSDTEFLPKNEGILCSGNLYSFWDIYRYIYICIY